MKCSWIRECLSGALLKGDSRHIEARLLVQQARKGEIHAATTVGILCEVYAALTWEGATPRHAPAVAADAVMAIIQAPSKIRVLPETESVLSMMLEIAKKNRLHARRIHDARHAATALVHDWSKAAFKGGWAGIGIQLYDTLKSEAIEQVTGFSQGGTTIPGSLKWMPNVRLVNGTLIHKGSETSADGNLTKENYQILWTVEGSIRGQLGMAAQQTGPSVAGQEMIDSVEVFNTSKSFGIGSPTTEPFVLNVNSGWDCP